MWNLLLAIALQTAPCSSATWLGSLPAPLDGSILWSADHELGSLYQWDLGGDPAAGGGVFNTGGAEVEAVATQVAAHSGAWAARASISNAFQAQNGSRAVRLMRWTDTHWSSGGQYFPDEAYYSVWMYFDHAYAPTKFAPWDPGDGGWWNIFQFKSEDALGNNDPMFAVNVAHDAATDEMSLYVYSDVNPPHSFSPPAPRPLPVGRWVHLEAYLRVSPTDQGALHLWQDGQELLQLDGVQTVLAGGDENPIWGIGNYTDHIAGGPTPGSATILFDDAAVATTRLSTVLAPWQRPYGELGASGLAPSLEGLGELTPGSIAQFRVTGAAPGSWVGLAIGFSTLQIPLGAGLLMPAPDHLILGLAADAAGAVSVCVPVPAALAGGATFLTQAWSLDGTGQLSSSPALLGTTP